MNLRARVARLEKRRDTESARTGGQFLFAVANEEEFLRMLQESNARLVDPETGECISPDDQEKEDQFLRILEERHQE